MQLDYYAQALERLTGKSVKEKLIYSFALSRRSGFGDKAVSPGILKFTDIRKSSTTGNRYAGTGGSGYKMPVSWKCTCLLDL